MFSRDDALAACLHQAPAGRQPLLLRRVLGLVVVGTLFMFLGHPVRIWKGVKILKVRREHAKDTRGKHGSFGVCRLALFVHFETESSLKFTTQLHSQGIPGTPDPPVPTSRVLDLQAPSHLGLLSFFFFFFFFLAQHS